MRSPPTPLPAERSPLRSPFPGKIGPGGAPGLARHGRMIGASQGLWLTRQPPRQPSLASANYLKTYTRPKTSDNGFFRWRFRRLACQFSGFLLYLFVIDDYFRHHRKLKARLKAIGFWAIFLPACRYHCANYKFNFLALALAFFRRLRKCFPHVWLAIGGALSLSGSHCSQPNR